MPLIKSINPFKCRMWGLHDRLEGYVTEDTCRAEIESFSRHGQLVPVLGRPLRCDPSHEVELIYGARRLFVARHINKPLMVELRDMSDTEAIVAMDIENRHRADVSPYERGLSYARWLRGGYFDSQEEIARALRVSCSQVSRLLKLARLPSVIVNAFGPPMHIREEWGLRLMEALDDPDRRDRTTRAARSIGLRSQRPPPQEIYRELLVASAPGRKVKSHVRDRVVKDDSGAPLFRVRHHQSSIALIVSLEKLSAARLDMLCSLLARHLQHEESSHVAIDSQDGECVPIEKTLEGPAAVSATAVLEYNPG
jgi:ParB family transcriptional regulator, chromosome partitioning protein